MPNTEFRQGDAVKLDFSDETFAIHDIMSEGRYGDMEKFVKELLDAGYEEVKLIPTDDGMFMTKREAAKMMLKGSSLLVGRK